MFHWSDIFLLLKASGAAVALKNPPFKSWQNILPYKNKNNNNTNLSGRVTLSLIRQNLFYKDQGNVQPHCFPQGYSFKNQLEFDIDLKYEFCLSEIKLPFLSKLQNTENIGELPPHRNIQFIFNMSISAKLFIKMHNMIDFSH